MKNSKFITKKGGTPGKPIRLLVSLLILKQLNDLSDETVVVLETKSLLPSIFRNEEVCDLGYIELLP